MLFHMVRKIETLKKLSIIDILISSLEFPVLYTLTLGSQKKMKLKELEGKMN